ncbi:uncharacterized protein LOC111366082 [Olea europaea subsp. europaea]|uniref:Uncharacterized protein LOC111366082 n=1 Tax=Olea europaea subsp. europaea TaxID=158383 RepID=A0A8S0UNX4_OLEEU|nr:uncharacterized protein LOC111366082 [Olea europaea subsp. europaea]
MEGGAAAVSTDKASESAAAASYTYWVRELTHDAAPRPVPKKLNVEDLPNQSNPTHLGSAWNRAGTWEEKSLNKWASDRIKELVVSVGALEFSGGRAEIAEVTRCTGDAFLVTVRNKKRVGYNYELTLRVNGTLCFSFCFTELSYFTSSFFFSFSFPCYFSQVKYGYQENGQLDQRGGRSKAI